MDSRVDAYIAGCADFAKPVLETIRRVVHDACPEVTETIKWGMPHFEYHGILCSMAAFKSHCALTFWRGGELLDPSKIKADGMGQFGKIRSEKDLPSDEELSDIVIRAMKLNETGATRRPHFRGQPNVRLELPAEASQALEANPLASAAFEALSPSHKREYAEWIAEGGKEATRQKRAARMVEQLRGASERD
jgi:hypothetical protein